jgi:hypothetical protein
MWGERDRDRAREGVEREKERLRGSKRTSVGCSAKHILANSRRLDAWNYVYDELTLEQTKHKV